MVLRPVLPLIITSLPIHLIRHVKQSTNYKHTDKAEINDRYFPKMTYYSQIRPGGRGMLSCLRFPFTLLARGGLSHDVTAGASVSKITSVFETKVTE